MRRKPMMMPTTMRRHDSGKMFGNLGVMWNPERMEKKEIRHPLTLTMRCKILSFQPGIASWTAHALTYRVTNLIDENLPLTQI